MSTPSIQRQSILSTIIILVGFCFGALNLLVLQRLILDGQQWGLTRVVTEGALLLSGFATLGMPMVTGKFLPFYKRYLPANQIDLPLIALKIASAGLAFTLLLLWVCKPYIIPIFGRNNPFFPPFYYSLVVFTIFQTVFSFMEMYAWYAGKTVATSALKELLFRVLTTVCLLLMWLGWVDFNGFMTLFACTYLPGAVWIIVIVVKAKGIVLYPKTSQVTRRLKDKMMALGSFVFFSQLSNIAFIVCDTLFLASLYNFKQAGIYAVAQYFSQVIEIPMRSMQNPSIPLISEYWRTKNFHGLQSIYRKSCINLLIAGMAIGGGILINLNNLGRFYGDSYTIMLLPLAILVFARWINLGTGLNTIILQLSTRWRFDFLSTMIYSIIGIPLNYLLITQMGMIGAAIASVIAMLLYNFVRFVFLYKTFGLQPFTHQNLQLLVGGLVIIGIIYYLPALAYWWLDAFLRSILFLTIFGVFVVKMKLSDEVNWLWQKWSKKLLPAIFFKI